MTDRSATIRLDDVEPPEYIQMDAAQFRAMLQDRQEISMVENTASRAIEKINKIVDGFYKDVFGKREGL